MSRQFMTVSLATLFLSLTFVTAPTFAASMSAGNVAQLITAINGANATPQADTILLTGNITLTAPYEKDAYYGYTGLPAITSNITIEGQGFTITRSASTLLDGQFRILRVASSGNLTLLNLTVSEGVSNYSNDPECFGWPCGGGAYNEGVLTIIHSRFLHNGTADNYFRAGQGGNLFNWGTLTIIDSTIEGGQVLDSGAGISNIGTLTVRDSLILNNNAGAYGGALHNMRTSGIATIINTTLAGNYAYFNGGAIESEGASLTIDSSLFKSNEAGWQGGGIFHGMDYTATMLITNSTFANNKDESRSGAIYPVISQGTIQNSTFVGNTSNSAGAIDIDFFIRMDNSLIVNNGGQYQCLGDLKMGGFNQSSDSACLPATAFTHNAAVNLAPLAKNGGPTQTFALNAGSSAFDAGDSSHCTTFDQRGVRRGIDADGTVNSPQAGDCDAGALEAGGIIRTVQFAGAQSDSPPVAGTVSVPLVLDGPLPAGYAPVKVYVWVKGGTAVAGTDYAPFGVRTATFHPGDTTATVTLDMLRTPTASRTVVLSIATQRGPGFSGPAVLGAQITHTIRLTSLADSAPPRNYFTTGFPTLTWNRVTGATGYEIEVNTDKTFKLAAAFHDSGIPANILYATPQNPLGIGTYYWRVRAKDSKGKWGLWSAVESFVIGT